MATKASPLKRAIRATLAATGPGRYQVQGKRLVCAICGHEQFKSGSYRPLLAMHPLICGNCTHVEFFEKLPERAESHSGGH
jgi:hypothetical protein